MGRNAAETPRNLLYRPYYAPASRANRFQDSKGTYGTYETFIRTLNEVIKKYSVKPPKRKNGTGAWGGRIMNQALFDFLIH
jgi:hypothetical protein